MLYIIRSYAVKIQVKQTGRVCARFLFRLFAGHDAKIIFNEVLLNGMVLIRTLYECYIVTRVILF